MSAFDDAADAYETRAFVDKEWADAETARDKAYERNEELGRGLVVGKTFSTQVADGFAYYEVTEVTDTTATVEWRDLHPDKWTDQVLGEGGTLPRDIIERLIVREEKVLEIFDKH